MKNINNFHIICLFMTAILLLGSCKKKDDDTPPNAPLPEPVPCWGKTYWDSIQKPSEDFVLIDYMEDRNFNIVFVWQEYLIGSEGIRITKLDTGLNELWTKHYPQIYGFSPKLIHDDYNNYYLVATDDTDSYYSSGQHYDNVWWQKLLSANPCGLEYDQHSGNLTTYHDKSKCYIHKFNENGNLLWSTEVEKFATGWSKYMAISDAGEIYIATYTQLGEADMPVYKDDVFQDTISLADSSDFHLYKISPNGIQIWSRSLKIPTSYVYGWYIGAGYFNIGVAISDGLVYVTASTGVFTFNMDGELLHEYRIPADLCKHSFIGSTDIVDGKMHVLCRYYDTTSDGPCELYAADYLTNGSLKWITETNGSDCDPTIFSLPDGGFLTLSNTLIVKYDAYGSFMWLKSLMDYQNIVVKPNCISGVMQMLPDWYDPYIYIMRTDENGNY